ncbi:alpha/beta hydrolase [Neisseria perflava]|uniref:alpha/beta hydrolase n=1 Tax=Neisseria perflava TaxID=33053 RepID=UPI00209EB326|nr:alpha/beta hydrolase [Neisseria perflava]MCP1660045.1 pimeloyl-ACP methyl ester carboxylesterase [Neisseria perflava]MCP1771937.1 pimeloyl-ACP methyl ester carboxylesterase [Neisseria perflava]
MKPDIVMMHGYMNTGRVWSQWQVFFKKLGYRVHCPSWPYADGGIADLQKNPAPQLADLTFDDVVAHYRDFIAALDGKPILFGHSLGGVVVQKLVETGCAHMAVCICSGPPKGIAAWNKDFILSNLQLLNPFSRSPTVWMSARWYHRYVTNDLTPAQTAAFRLAATVPAGRKVAATIGRIDFAKPHVPLLFIAGASDKSQPAVISQKTAAAYTDRSSQTDFHVFPLRTHNILNQHNWQEVAAYIAEWLAQQSAGNMAATQ